MYENIIQFFEVNANVDSQSSVRSEIILFTPALIQIGGYSNPALIQSNMITKF